MIVMIIIIIVVVVTWQMLLELLDVKGLIEPIDDERPSCVIVVY